MKLVKVFISFLLLLISCHVIAETKIVFLNGIDGDYWKNDDSKLKLSSIMQKAGYGTKLSAVRYVAWNNPGDGALDDKIELLKQARLSGQAMTIAKITNPSATPQGSDYYQVLGNLYKDQINSGEAESEEARHVYSIIKDLSFFISEEIFRKGNRLIIVSHSQGNFFAEAVAAYLTVTKTTSENNTLDANLRFVGVASVAASTPHYRYISAEEDKALFAHVGTTALINNFSILPLNVSFCGINPFCGTSIMFLQDATIHGFQETYTSDLIDKKTNKPIYKLLADMVNDSFDEIYKDPTNTNTGSNVIGSATVGLISLKSATIHQDGDAYDTVEWINNIFSAGNKTIFATYDNPSLYTNGHTFNFINGAFYQSVGNWAGSNTTWIPMKYTAPPNGTSVWAVAIDQSDRTKWAYVKLR